MCSLVRNLSAAVLLAILLKAYAWPIFAAFIVGLALAVAVAMLITVIARGLHLARWIAASLALVAFVMVLTEAVGDLTPVSEIFDQVGFSIGERRFSLLTLLQIGITILALYAGVKLVNRLVGQSVKRASGLDSTQQLLVQKLVAIGLLVRSEEHTSELQSLMRISYAVFCLKKKK